MRRTLRHLAVLAIVVSGVGYVAGPALSTRPYMPGGVDFEQPLTRFARVQTAPGAKPVYRSSTIEAPARFDLAGLADERRPVEMRARLGDDGWTRWTRTSDRDPIYFGGADELQVRARGWRPSGTLHYVNVSGTTTEADSLLTGARRVINSGFMSVASLIEPAAQAAPARPQIITRAQWGANLKRGGCHPRAAPAYGTVKAAVIHHTVTAVNYTEEEAPEIVLGICRYHRNANGWNDIGYQALIDRFGNVYAGRAGGIRKPVVGAQAQGFNAQTTAVASIGTHTTRPLEPAAYDAFVDYLAWRLVSAGLPAFGHTTLVSAGGELSRYPRGRRVRTQRLFGHRTVGRTACPGNAFNAQLPELRRDVQSLIDTDSGGVGRDQAIRRSRAESGRSGSAG